MDNKIVLSSSPFFKCYIQCVKFHRSEWHLEEKLIENMFFYTEPCVQEIFSYTVLP